jgi:RNA polymerase sigma-70 factor (ECF subfamily)
METDTQELVENARKGDRAAAIQLIELFYKRIYAFLRRLAGSDADAEDLTQRTFSRVWQALPTYAGRASVSSWLHSIAHHVYVDWRRSDHQAEQRPDDWWADCAASEPSPDEMAARTDWAQTLYRSVDNLIPKLRETVHLRYYQDLTLQETADVLGVATSTVKYRLRQALAELQKKLASDPSRIEIARGK